MNFLKDSRTNWKYILIVAIVAALVGGGIYLLQDKFLIEKGVTPSLLITPAPDDVEKSTEDVSDKSGFIGIESGRWPGGESLEILLVIEGSPADKAGLKADDEIIKINDKLVSNLSKEEISNLVRGKPGTEVVLTVCREGWKEDREFKIKRIAVKTLPPKICPSPDGLSDVPASELSELVDLPEFFPEVSWEKVSTSEPHFGDGVIYCYFGRITSCGDSSICGDEWVARINVSTHKEMRSKIDAFVEYFESELSKRDWAWKVNVKGFEFSGAAADGPGGIGSMWGYIKVQNRRLRTIVLAYHYSAYGPEVISDEFTPYEIHDCPCEIEFRIFVSKIISLDKFLP